MKCLQCAHENSGDARFCEECGRPLEQTCPNCSQGVSIKAKFCRNCGYDLGKVSEPVAATRLISLQQAAPAAIHEKILSSRAHIEGERKQVTVLFTDIVGSTGLAERLDPEEWGEIVSGAHQRVSEAVYRYEGTIAQLLGDGVLAFFGAPLTHEDDAERAVRAALDISRAIVDYSRELAAKKGIQNFQMRMGLNTGLVVVGSIGSNLHMEYLAIGDAVNLAARMEQTAGPDTVQMAENTYKLVAPLFDCEGPFALELKGKSEQVQAYRVLRPKDERGSLRGIEGLGAPLIGREKEMGLLREAINGLLQGRGQLVSVMGEAGLGKSRLMTELRKALVFDGLLPGPTDEADIASVGNSQFLWFEGRSFSYESSTGYAPFNRLLTSLFGLRQGETDAEKYEKVRDQVAQVLPEQLLDVAPYIAAMLGVQLTGEAWERVRYLQPPQVRERVFRAVQLYLERVATNKPLVLVFEDLHWADPISLDLVQQLMPLTDRVPLLLIGVFRPARQEPSWRVHEVANRDYPHRYIPLLLEPLTESDTRTLVANLLYIEDLPERVHNLILTKAEGNPFFVEEVIRSLLDAHLIVRDDSHWRATKEIENIAVPNTLAGVILSRLDRLDETSKQVLQAASVIGREFSLEALTAISERGESLEKALADLERRELVRERGRRPQRVYIFKHVLTQETAYGSLLLSTCRELHRRTAEFLEQTIPDGASEIARHFLAAREEVRALPYLVQAGERASFAHSLKEAITFFRKAVDILESVRDASLARRAFEGLGGGLALSFDVPGAVDTFHRMIHVAETYENLPMKVSALNKLARVTALMQGRFPEAEVHLGEAERLALLCEDLPGLTELHMSYCSIRSISGDIDGALAHQRTAIQIGKEKIATELKLFGMSHCANSLTFMTHFDEALQQADDAITAAEKEGNRLHKTWAMVMPVTWYHLRLGDLETARREGQRGIDSATQIGAEDAESAGDFLLGHIARLQGRYEEAIAWQRRATNAARASGFLFVEAGALCALGSLYWEISDKNREQAEEFYSQSLKMMESPFGLVLAAQSWTDMGYYALARGQVDKAWEVFQKALTERSTFRYLLRPAALVGSAMASVAQGDLEEAARLSKEAWAFAEERTMRLYYPIIARGNAHIAAAKGDTEMALESYDQAESLALDMGMRPLVWQVRSDTARLLSRSGRNDEAEVLRRKAQEMSDEIAALFKDTSLRAEFVHSAMNMRA
ncbi:MAG: AAA family ATPase [Chloroflexi bacterium]|nr:AAA family ATPase [Chloroflexota bacterium]